MTGQEVGRARFKLAVSYSQTEPDGQPKLRRIHLTNANGMQVS
jgi:hypothetical protein